MKRTAYTLLLALVVHVAQATIGQWNAYMAYYHITDIEPAGEKIYVLSSHDLFSYNVNDQSVEVYNKVNCLTDNDINYIAWCKSAKRLVIIYSNFNIDLLDNDGNVVNISDYYSKSMTVDKTINNITIYGNDAYLSTGFGVIKLNVKEAEISETYNLGMPVLDCFKAGNTLFLRLEQGISKAETTQNLLDPSSWIATDEAISFVDDNDITVSTVNGYTEYIAYDSTNKCYWSNQSDGKLQGYTLNDNGERTVICRDINPEGPKYNYFGFLKFLNNRLYSCNGTWGNMQEGTIQVLENDAWTIYQDESISEKTGLSYQDITAITIDPNDQNHVMAGSRNGLYEFQDGRFVNYFNYENSPIELALQYKNPEYQLITAVMYDNSGENLWLLNSQAATQSIISYSKSGTWTSHKHDELMNLNVMNLNGYSIGNMSNMMTDSRGITWFVNNNWQYHSFFSYDTSTDNIEAYTSFVNQDGTTVSINYVRCIAEDKEGNMFIGTDRGLLMLPQSEISRGGKQLYQVKVPRNDGTNYADYLLAGVDITCIAIDGGNRKWFGTNGNGLYLISDDNMEQLQHFTADNSNLLSDNIMSLAINDKTGEVFIGTDQGLCSYMSDATETNEVMNKDNVYAYPNPVRPDYTGLITITGLSYHADVKILTANGELVAEGKSNGGSFTWDGCDRNGKRVASGVYMVHTATREGSKGTVCKIAIIR